MTPSVSGESALSSRDHTVEVFPKYSKSPKRHFSELYLSHGGHVTAGLYVFVSQGAVICCVMEPISAYVETILEVSVCGGMSCLAEGCAPRLPVLFQVIQVV